MIGFNRVRRLSEWRKNYKPKKPRTMRTKFTSQSALRAALCLLFLVAASVLTLVGIAASELDGQTSRSSRGGTVIKKIAPWVIQHTANGQRAEFFVVLGDQADLSQAEALQAKAEKGRYVYETLLNKSRTTQGPILQWLRERGLEHRSFYIVNAILVKGTREIVEALAARPDVARVEGNPLIHNNLPQPAPAIEAPLQPQVPNTIEPGIAYTRAPDVWALGYTGQDIVVGSADSGVRWTHNALKPHYRGWNGQNADHNYNWHDSIHDSVGNPCGNDSPFPCDDDSHGSHTTGTMVGDDGMGNQIGMAPGAKWIGCRNMDQGNGTPARYIECMEWFLAPYPIGGGQGDPTKAPDITNNSWVCLVSEGCSPDTLQAAVEAQAAAGIMMVAAAGNDGPSCSTVWYAPAIYSASYTVGGLVTGSDTIASFSSRGPVQIDGSGRIKPDITAPSTGTRSCSNAGDDSYAIMSGTSMATPHIAGAMGLLWSAIPSLKNQIDASRAAMNNAAHFISSTQCGDAGPPNNVYGWGRVDIAAAVGAPSPTPTPTPSVTPTPTASPGGCQFGVLIAYADYNGAPTQFQSEILAEPGVVVVDLFDAASGTPTLSQLLQYQIVVPFSNFAFADDTTLGNNLADYVDAGGIVVQYGFSFYGPNQPYGINGRWVSGNYNPYDYSTKIVQDVPFTLGSYNAGHPLMAGVTTLNSNFQNVVTLASGATEVAAASNGNSLVAFRPVSGGHTTVGVTGFVGHNAMQSGEWGRVVVNAGRWLLNCGPTSTPTPTPTATVTPIARPSPTPKPRPTPPPRP